MGTKLFSDLITFTRASSATRFNSSGTLVTMSTDQPRFDYDPVTLAPKGLLIEEQRTNSIRNNTMVGAVAGTPGTLPTNWTEVSMSGITTSVVSIGVESGVSYIDYRVSGTPSVSTFYNMVPDFVVLGSSGQTWTGGFWAKLVAGSLTNTNTNLEIRESTSTQAFLTNSLQSISLDGTLKRYSNTKTLTNASTTYVSVRLVNQLTIDLPVDFTLRIGMPQLEQGAFATSVIPTSGTEATRASDVAVMTGTNFSSWYRQDEGTLFAEWGLPVNVSDNNPLFSFDANGLPTMAIRMGNNGGRRIRAYAQTTGGLFEYVADAPINTSTTGKSAFSYLSANSFSVADGGNVITDNTGNISAQTFTQANIGRNAMTYANGHIRRITYYPRRLSNSELQALTS